jgi:truncated hemoglobin YjbI
MKDERVGKLYADKRFSEKNPQLYFYILEFLGSHHREKFYNSFEIDKVENQSTIDELHFQEWQAEDFLREIKITEAWKKKLIKWSFKFVPLEEE